MQVRPARPPVSVITCYTERGGLLRGLAVENRTSPRGSKGQSSNFMERRLLTYLNG